MSRKMWKSYNFHYRKANKKKATDNIKDTTESEKYWYLWADIAMQYCSIETKTLYLWFTT